MASATTLHDATPGRSADLQLKRTGERALDAVRERARKKQMLPPAPRNPPARPADFLAASEPQVVDDDEFETKLAAIIERDYFPDIKRLQNKLEWTRATESGDADHIANAQRNIVLRRAGFSVPLNAQVPCSSGPSPTPDRSQSGLNTSSSNATPSTPATAAADKQPPLPEGTILPPSQDVASFTARHTTEDQAAMDSIVAADNARRRMRYQWAYEESDRTNAHLLASGHQPGLLLAPPPHRQISAAIGSSESAATIAEGASSSAPAADGALEGGLPGDSDGPLQSNHHPSALVITLPDDGGTPRRRTRRAHPMPVLRSSHATTPSRAAIAVAKCNLLRAKAQGQNQAHSLPLSMNERQLLSSGAPPQTIAAQQAQVQARTQVSSQGALLHSAKSALYYPPAHSLPLSLNERQLMSAGAPPQTIAAHTRFPSSSETAANGLAGVETPETLASTPSGVYPGSPASSSGGVNAQVQPTPDGNVSQIGGVFGMRAVATPSPAHLGAAVPIMTWGEVAGTPMVLDEEGLFRGEGAAALGVTSRGVLQAPRSVKETAAETARKELALARVRGHNGWSQGRRGEQTSRSALSPAAQTFVKKLQGKSPWAQLDNQLRAAYGHRTPGTSSRSALAQTTVPALTPVATGSLSSASPRGLLGHMTPERHA